MLRNARGSIVAAGCIVMLAGLPGCPKDDDGSEPAAGSGGTTGGDAGTTHTSGGAGAAAPGGGSGGKMAAAGKGGTGGKFAGNAGAAAGSGSGDDAGVSDNDVARSNTQPDTAPSISDADFATFLSHVNKFGLDVGQKMASDNNLTHANIIYSPVSVTYALGMTYAGAKGTTADEMKTTLGDSFTAGVFHEGANKLARTLESRVTSRPDTNGNAHKIELNLADALFVEKSLSVKSDFLDLLARDYDSGVHQQDFKTMPEPARMTINQWVSDQTKDKIQNLFTQGTITEQTRLVLVNALYFYGTWTTPFKMESTHDATFHALAGDVQAPTMGVEVSAPYRMATDFEVAELPYEGGHLRMTIVLPASGKFDSVREAVSEQWLSDAVQGLANAQLQVSLPKFGFTVGSFSLKSALEALGMKAAFTDGADFSGMSSDAQLSLSDVVQKAFVKVDENGTEAAAATGVVVGTSAVLQTTPFVVDRPFLFFIRDDSGAVLFSGQVVDPTQP